MLTDSDKAKLIFHEDKILKSVSELKFRVLLDKLVRQDVIDDSENGMLIELETESDQDTLSRTLMQAVMAKTDAQLKHFVSILIAQQPELKEVFDEPLPPGMDAWNGFYCLPHVCVCVGGGGCQRKTKDRADGMREKSAHCPQRDSNLYLWDTRP